MNSIKEQICDNPERFSHNFLGLRTVWDSMASNVGWQGIWYVVGAAIGNSTRGSLWDANFNFLQSYEFF